MNEEPLILPPTLGAALERVSQLRGAMAREENLAAALPGQTSDDLRALRDELISVLESGDHGARQSALAAAQNAIRRIYETLSQPGIENAPRLFALLKFPDPLGEELAPVDISTVLTTFTCPQRQVWTTIAFDASPGARAYRLRETRVVAGEDFVDDTLESLTPIFRRVRMPAGTHRLSIESRDASGFVVSPEFEVTVPHDA